MIDWPVVVTVEGQPSLGFAPLQINYRGTVVTPETAARYMPAEEATAAGQVQQPITINFSITAPPAQPVDLTPLVVALDHLGMEIALLRADLASRTWAARWARLLAWLRRLGRRRT